jgi:polyphosphate glucokinase
MKAPVKVLVVDIGGTSVKILATGQTERRKFPSGKGLTPGKMVAGVKKLAKGWEYDVVSIGYPGPVREGRPAAEPHNLARGWVGFKARRGGHGAIRLRAPPRRCRARRRER